jgi:hypothetical protein
MLDDPDPRRPVDNYTRFQPGAVLEYRTSMVKCLD